VPPPPFGPGGRAHSLGGEGLGEFLFPTRGHTLWCSVFISTLCCKGTVYLCMTSYICSDGILNFSQWPHRYTEHTQRTSFQSPHPPLFSPTPHADFLNPFLFIRGFSCPCCVQASSSLNCLNPFLFIRGLSCPSCIQVSSSLNCLNPFLFIRGLSCPSCIQVSLSLNCLNLTDCHIRPSKFK
jgi:hypothetical protein